MVIFAALDLIIKLVDIMIMMVRLTAEENSG